MIFRCISIIYSTSFFLFTSLFIRALSASLTHLIYFYYLFFWFLLFLSRFIFYSASFISFVALYFTYFSVPLFAFLPYPSFSRINFLPPVLFILSLSSFLFPSLSVNLCPLFLFISLLFFIFLPLFSLFFQFYFLHSPSFLMSLQRLFLSLFSLHSPSFLHSFFLFSSSLSYLSFPFFLFHHINTFRLQQYEKLHIYLLILQQECRSFHSAQSPLHSTFSSNLD